MRRPKQVLVFIYKKVNNDYFYCIFLRKSGIWQGISGGVEDDESLIETVKREVFEETGICVNDMYQLSSISSIPVVDITKESSWDNDVYVVPEYSFGVPLENHDIHLSSEHKEYKWCLFDETYEKLKFDSNKTALWELNQRLLNNDIKRPEIF